MCLLLQYTRKHTTLVTFHDIFFNITDLDYGKDLAALLLLTVWHHYRVIMKLIAMTDSHAFLIF